MVGGHFCYIFMTTGKIFCPKLCVVVCGSLQRIHIKFKIIVLCIYGSPNFTISQQISILFVKSRLPIIYDTSISA